MDTNDNIQITPEQQQMMEDAKKKGGKIPPQFLKNMKKMASKGGKSMKGGKGAPSKGKMGGY